MTDAQADRIASAFLKLLLSVDGPEPRQDACIQEMRAALADAKMSLEDFADLGAGIIAARLPAGFEVPDPRHLIN
jgi:hypothetical protein